MITYLLGLLFLVLLLLLLDGNWRYGLLVMVLIGFAQDPIRKLTPGQPALLVGMVLVAFAGCAFVMFESRGKADLKAMFWAAPEISEWIPIYFLLIILQAANGFLKFTSPTLAVIGSAFYLAPAIGLWVGFRIGLDQTLLRRILALYVFVSVIFAGTVFLSYRGIESPLLSEVGETKFITFRYGFQAVGSCGLWRTSEIAAWHLAAASCLCICLATSIRKTNQQVLLLVMAVGFALMTITTARRKALVLVLAFTAIYSILFSRRADAQAKEQLIANLFGVAGLSYVAYYLLLSGALGDNFNEYLKRASTASGELISRFRDMGYNAGVRAFELSDGIGLGIGAASQTGGLQLNFDVQNQYGSALRYVAESGLGKIVVELGLPGIIIIAMLSFYIFQAVRRNFSLLKYLPPSTSILLMGLLAFSLANIPFYLAASQVYSDPYILIVLSLCFGSSLAIPSLLARNQQALQSPPRLQRPLPAMR
jgi:hypothetical protein